MVIEYSPQMLSKNFKQENRDILSRKRGGGYWIWKPYIIWDALSKLEDGDYLIYSDSGCAFIDSIFHLLDIMRKYHQKIMIFSLATKEFQYTKRDAFLLMGCDEPEFVYTPQKLAGYIVFEKSPFACRFVEEWLKYAVDKRIITDDENVMGQDNYPGFIDHRHDQSILSLLSKKWKLPAFRDCSQYGKEIWYSDFTDKILERSSYPQIIDLHRCAELTFDSWEMIRNGN